jgi:hypothetical protein
MRSFNPQRTFGNQAKSMQNEFYNQPVVNWAQQNFPKPVEIKLLFSSRLGKIFTYLLVFFVPLVFIVGGTLLKFTDAGNRKDSDGALASSANRALACGTVLLIPSGIIVLLGLFMQTKFAKSLESDGVKGSFGQKFGWGKLYYVDHVTKHYRAGRVGRKIKDNQLELVFESGKVTIPPLIRNREQIWSLINTMPVQVRDDNVIRETQNAGILSENKQSVPMNEILKMIESLPASKKDNR